MLDTKLLRTQLDQIIENLNQRGFEFPKEKFQTLEMQRRELGAKLQELEAQRNKISKTIGIAKSKGEDSSSMMQEVVNCNQQIEALTPDVDKNSKELRDLELNLPNLLHVSVPIGQSEKDNVEISRFGELPKFSFTPKDHITLGEQSRLIDFESAGKLSGARFTVLHGDLAKLHRALGQFMLNLHTQEHGYRETYVPYLVKSDALYGTGQLPKFREDQFSIASDRDLILIPTAEVSLTNLVRETILNESDLPLKLTAQTPCFRSEAGSYGKDTRGMIRQHQFEKVELVQIVKPEKSYEALEELRSHAEKILQLLQLPYRVVALCSKDIGFSAAKTYDLEVWLPGQNAYREISSCSNCEAFQARRMQARYRTTDGKIEPVHTLNGSGVAVGRALVAVMENYQQADGRIKIPDVLRPYMGNQEYI